MKLTIFTNLGTSQLSFIDTRNIALCLTLLEKHFLCRYSINYMTTLHIFSAAEICNLFPHIPIDTASDPNNISSTMLHNTAPSIHFLFPLISIPPSQQAFPFGLEKLQYHSYSYNPFQTINQSLFFLFLLNYLYTTFVRFITFLLIVSLVSNLILNLSSCKVSSLYLKKAVCAVFFTSNKHLTLSPTSPYLTIEKRENHL